MAKSALQSWQSAKLAALGLDARSERRFVVGNWAEA